MKKQSNSSLSIGFRVTDKEKKHIENKAKKAGIDELSEYIRWTLLHDKKKAVDEDAKQIVMEVVVQATEILNYVTDKYGENEVLEKKVKKLWKSLS